MESASLRRAAARPELIQLGLLVALLTFAALAWVITDQRMGGMDAGPATDPGSLGFWLTAWVVMMAAMMFPSIAPMVLTHARIEQGKRRKGRQTQAGASALFVGGYLLAWTAAGAAGYAVIEAGEVLSPGFLDWDRAGPYIAGGVIVAAAIYQLTPLKDVCLRHCRNPITFLLMRRRSGRVGAVRMGVEHGAWCVGCCWALMAALFALGVMNIGWMVLIAALITAEKLLPWKQAANRGVAVLLLALGLAVALAPQDVPGLTLPNEAGAMGGMGGMEMEQSDPAMEPSGMEMEQSAPATDTNGE